MSREVILFVPDVAEFRPVVDSARATGESRVTLTDEGYNVIRSQQPLRFSRKALGVKPPIWYAIPTGGLVGQIVQFDRDTLVIEPES